MSSPRISLIHPLGSPFARNAALALWEVHFLSEVVTAIAYNPTGALARWLNALPKAIGHRLTQELGRRTWTVPEGVSITSYPGRELLRILAMKTGLVRRLGLPYQRPVDWVYAAIDRQVARHHLTGIQAVYAYEDGAADTFQAAKTQGIQCLYDLPIAFYQTSRDVQAEEAARFPELAAALQAVKEPTWKVERKHREIELADHIFVPSSFVKQSLLTTGVATNKVTVIPFGAPVEYFQPQPKPDKTFRVLFVGRVGPRKGVHYLLPAWKELNLPDAELVLVGINEFPQGWLEQYSDRCRYVPSVPHASLNEYYSNASVFVLPSLVEGMALVQLEAMACGIPIITTPHAGGGDIITDGVEGFMIPVRDREALKTKLEWCYQHPQELAAMGQAARRKAEQLTWQVYRQRLGEQVKTVLGCVQ